jgi:hypothetical protein
MSDRIKKLLTVGCASPVYAQWLVAAVLMAATGPFGEAWARTTYLLARRITMQGWSAA